LTKNYLQDDIFGDLNSLYSITTSDTKK
jgi:hypothetical protein